MQLKARDGRANGSSESAAGVRGENAQHVRNQHAILRFLRRAGAGELTLKSGFCLRRAACNRFQAPLGGCHCTLPWPLLSPQSAAPPITAYFAGNAGPMIENPFPPHFPGSGHVDQTIRVHPQFGDDFADASSGLPARTDQILPDSQFCDFGAILNS